MTQALLGELLAASQLGPGLGKIAQGLDTSVSLPHPSAANVTMTNVRILRLRLSRARVSDITRAWAVSCAEKMDCPLEAVEGSDDAKIAKTSYDFPAVFRSASAVRRLASG